MGVSNREINNKLAGATMNFPQTARLSNQTWTHLPPTKDPPSPLDWHDFDDVKFWTKSSWNIYERSQRGATNGNAKRAKKRGRPEKETPDDDGDSLEPNTTHIYLEEEDGIPVSKALVTQQGQKMRSLWATLGKHGLAPTVWSEADSLTIQFVDSSILTDPRFHYLRLCDDNWKLKHWISKNYPSWVRNHLALDSTVKAKKEALDNKNLLKITPDPSDDELKMMPDQSDALAHEESSTDTLENIRVSFFFPHIVGMMTILTIFQMESSPPSHPITALNIVDPLQYFFTYFRYRSKADTLWRDDDADEDLDNQMCMLSGSPEATPTQSPQMPTDAHADEAQGPTTTGLHVDSEVVPALATVEGMSLTTPAAPTNASVAEGLS